MKPADGKWHLVPDGGRPVSDMDFAGLQAQSTYDDFVYDTGHDWYVGQLSGVMIAFTEKDPPEPDKLDFVARWDDNGVIRKFMGTASKVP